MNLGSMVFAVNQAITVNLAMLPLMKANSSLRTISCYSWWWKAIRNHWWKFGKLVVSYLNCIYTIATSHLDSSSFRNCAAADIGEKDKMKKYHKNTKTCQSLYFLPCNHRNIWSDWSPSVGIHYRYWNVIQCRYWSNIFQVTNDS